MTTFRGFKAVHDPENRTRVSYAEDKELIESSVRAILTTKYKERVMVPGFGSLVFDILFEPLDEILKVQLKREIAEAISRWENRYIVDDVVVSEDTDNEHGIVAVILYHFRDNIQDVQQITINLSA